MEEKMVMFEKIWERHKYLIGDTNFHNKRLLILIAGAPGSGKTTLLKLLQKQFHSLYIRSDDIRDILNNEYGDNVLANNPELKNEYIEYIFETKIKELKNQTIVIDMSMDRNADFPLYIADTFNYPRYIISLDCSFDILKQRLSDREKEYKEAFLNNLPKWYEDHRKFDDKKIADIYLDSGNLSSEDMLEKIMLDI